MASTTVAGEMILFKYSRQKTFSSQSQGFTLIELILTILLVAILSTVTAYVVQGTTDANRYEQTRQKMESIRTAIIGTDAINQEGHRTSFGYHGDWGGLPSTLSNLVTSQVPSYSFDSTYGFGAGWKGPYLDNQFVDITNLLKDAWGVDFAYDTASSPPQFVSYGSDGVLGGSVFAKDLVIQFPVSHRFSTVRGTVLDAETRLSGQTVEIRYPVSGVITPFTTTTDANGIFSFPNVPFGVRSIRVTSGSGIPPRQILVDSSQVVLSTSLLNFMGSLQKLTYEAGSAATGGLNNSHVDSEVTSGYVTAMQVEYATVSWTGGGGYLYLFSINNTQQVLPNLPSGTRFNVQESQIFPAQSSNNELQFRVAANSDGSGGLDMRSRTVTVRLEWTTAYKYDTISFTTPS